MVVLLVKIVMCIFKKKQKKTPPPTPFKGRSPQTHAGISFLANEIVQFTI